MIEQKLRDMLEKDPALVLEVIVWLREHGYYVEPIA